MDDRRQTLLALVELARASDPAGCWDEGRAERLLRTQSTREELRALDVDDWLIDHIFEEES